jgi:catechol 2,3-dioxygenase-like lactoylglutathione lyase family enzyme
MPNTMSHIGVCVSDLDRSLRFYCDGLGFQPAIEYQVGNEFGDALEVEGDVKLTSKMITHGNFMIELLYYETPGVTGAPSTSRGQLGITHISLYVDDIDAMIERLVEHGGTYLPSTRTANDEIDLGFVTDPDGTRVELMQQK